MTSLTTTTALLGAILAAAILYCIRRDHLHIRAGLFWLSVAVVAITLGTLPHLSDHLGKLFGVSYPPTLVLLIAIIALLLKALNNDIKISRLERDIKRLSQLSTITHTPAEARYLPADGKEDIAR